MFLLGQLGNFRALERKSWWIFGQVPGRWRDWKTAFSQTDADAVFLTATDLPCGSVELANHLLKELGEADACVICRRDGKPEPTFGVYRRNCQKAVKMLLDEDQRTFRTLFDRIHVRWLYEKELAEFPLEQLLQNINTPEEYEKLQRFCQNDQ